MWFFYRVGSTQDPSSNDLSNTASVPPWLSHLSLIPISVPALLFGWRVYVLCACVWAACRPLEYNGNRVDDMSQVFGRDKCYRVTWLSLSRVHDPSTFTSPPLCMRHVDHGLWSVFSLEVNAEEDREEKPCMQPWTGRKTLVQSCMCFSQHNGQAAFFLPWCPSFCLFLPHDPSMTTQRHSDQLGGEGDPQITHVWRRGRDVKRRRREKGGRGG